MMQETQEPLVRHVRVTTLELNAQAGYHDMFVREGVQFAPPILLVDEGRPEQILLPILEDQKRPMQGRRFIVAHNRMSIDGSYTLIGSVRSERQQLTFHVLADQVES